MRISTAEIFKFVLTTVFSFSFLFLSAQTKPDSIPMGVISVKRPPVPATFRISLVYFDPDSSKDRKRVTEISFKQIVFGDSVFNPTDPQPFGDYDYAYELATHLEFDSLTDDRAKPSISSVPVQEFDWEKYLKLIPWQFEWSDTSKMDSARFEFTIDKKGNAKLGVLPWKKKEDSTQLAFEKSGALYLGLLRQWYPAKRIKSSVLHGRQPKYRNVACKVIVTLYAFDPNEGRLLPLEITGPK